MPRSRQVSYSSCVSIPSAMRLRADLAGQLDEHLHEVLLDRLLGERRDEALGDLQVVGRERGDRFERGVAGAGVVDGHLDPLVAELVEQLAEDGVVLDGGALGELEDEVAAVLGEERHHLVDAELRLAEHLRLEVEQELAVAAGPPARRRFSAPSSAIASSAQASLASRAKEKSMSELRNDEFGRAAREDLVAEDGRVLRPDDRLEERRHALAADDVAQLARELLLALLLGVAHGVARRSACPA